MKKETLRGAYISKRESLSERECQEASQEISNRFLGHFDLESVSLIHHFFPMTDRKEVDPLLITTAIRKIRSGIRMAVPRIDSSSGCLESLEVHKNTRFSTNNWGIKEPVGEKLVNELDIDLVLVPLLCFDTTGHRVGYGKGYYDRFLAKCRPDCRKIGLSFFDPVETIDNTQDYDIPLDYCVTPEKVFDFSA